MSWQSDRLAESPLKFFRLGGADAAIAGADKTGGTALTLSGSGVTYGTSGAISGDTDTAITFDGTSGCGSVALDLSPHSAITVEFWLKVASWENYQFPLEYTDSGGGNIGGWYVNTGDGGDCAFTLGTAVAFNSAKFAQPSTGAWHHFAFVVDLTADPADVITPYVDGVAVSYVKGASGAPPTAFPSSTLYVGARTNSAFWLAGAMDELIIYPTALDATTIAEHAEGVSSGGEETPVVILPGTALYPSDSWDGTTAWTGRTPPVDPARTTFKPTAHFGIVPHQDVTGDFTIPVLAYCKGGVESVQVWCEGNAVVLTERSVASEYEGPDFETFICTLDASEFPAFDGPFKVYATITPSDGSAQARVISIPLYRNKGTAFSESRYVSITGNNTTGDGTEGNPFATISKARDVILAAQAGDPGGGNILLLDGPHQYGADPENFNIATLNRWLTIKPAPGVSRNDAVISSTGPNGLRTGKVRMQGVAVDQSSGWTIGSNGPMEDYFWLDGCICTGPGRTVENSKPIAAPDFTAVYVTDSECSGYRDGFVNAQLIRNCKVHDIASDSYMNARCLIHGESYEVDGTGTTFHNDVLQWQGSFENVIVYGVNAHDQIEDGQTIFNNGNGVSDMLDLAIVNCFAPSTYATVSALHSLAKLSHLVVRNCTFDQNFLLGDNTVTEHLDVQHNVFKLLYLGAEAAGAEIDRNHFTSGTAHGTNASTGTPGYNPATKIPDATGNLRPGVSRLTLVDILGNTRSTDDAAIGAFAAADEYTSDTPPTITSAGTKSGQVGVGLSYTISATGTAPITYGVSGALPGGLTFDGVDTISGTPTTAGVRVATITATNSAGEDGDTLTFTIAAAPPTGDEEIIPGEVVRNAADTILLVGEDRVLLLPLIPGEEVYNAAGTLLLVGEVKGSPPPEEN